MKGADPTGRSVIVVVADSVRGDIFEQEAHNFIAMSAQGLSFRRAIAPAAWTLPSHVSMFTGLRPTEHRAVASGLPKTELRATVTAIVNDCIQRDALLAPRLQSRGIRTFSSTPNPWLGAMTGLDRGFDDHDFFGFLDAGHGRSARPTRRNASSKTQQLAGVARASWRHARWVADGRDKGAARVLARLKDFVRRVDGPFFAFVNLIEAHEPHVHPATERRFRNRDHLKAIANAILQPGPVRAQRVRRHNWGVSSLPPELLNLWENAYRAEIRYLDAWLVRLSEVLETNGRLEDTTVIASSDHGENFGERGIVGHGLSLEESTARVPLGIWGADVPQETIDDPVSLVSLRATVEDLMLSTDHRGSLLHPGSRGEAVIEIEDPKHVNRPPRGAKRTSRGPGAAFYDGDLKYVVDPFYGESLYDLAADASGLEMAQGATPTESQQIAKRGWEARLSRSSSRSV